MRTKGELEQKAAEFEDRLQELERARTRNVNAITIIYARLETLRWALGEDVE